MGKRKLFGVVNIVFEILIVVSAGFGFRPMLETVFGGSDLVAYIGKVGGALLAALVIVCIKGSREDEKELERLRAIEKMKKEDRD